MKRLDPIQAYDWLPSHAGTCLRAEHTKKIEALRKQLAA